MHLPDVNGSIDQSDFFFFTACDSQYFDQFAPSLINSILKNTKSGIHLHVYNITDAQRRWNSVPGVSITSETVAQGDFGPAAVLLSNDTSDLGQNRLRRSQNAMEKGQDSDLAQRIMKTYFACARFVRLAELCPDVPCLAIDIDAIVRRTPTAPLPGADFYLHRIQGKRARYLAGALWLCPTETTKRFLGDYADQLRQYIERDEIYWGLDQDLLEIVVPKYNHGNLSIDVIDWNMSLDSSIWTAKGTRKNLEIFISEQQRYSSL